jgi:hypothetical protein
LKDEPLLDPLRKEPRFQAIERELELPNGVEPVVPSHFPSRPNVRPAEIYVVELSVRSWPPIGPIGL